MKRLLLVTFILAFTRWNRAMQYGPGTNAGGMGYSSTQTVGVNYAQEWQGLYDVPIFRTVCDWGSGVNSAGIAQRLIQGNNNFDYYNLFNNMYRQNDVFQRYIFATTGVRCREESSSRRFFNIVKQKPAGLLRSLGLFARHPHVFKSPLVRFALTNKSREILQAGLNRQIAYNNYRGYFSDILRSRYYRNKFTGIFGCRENEVLAALQNAYTQNGAGILLLVKHVITRRRLYARNAYFSANYNQYIAQNSMFRNKAWRHNDYYSSFQEIMGSSGLIGSAAVVGGGGGGGGGLGYGRQASLQRQGSFSKQVQVQETVHETEHEASTQVGIEGGIEGGASVGHKAASRTVTRTTTTTINYQEEWKELYEEPLFQDVCHLGSNAKSAIIGQKFLQKSSKYDYATIFSNLYNRNDKFQRYMHAATGFQGTSFDTNRYFSFVRESPGSLLRMVNLFAKHPNIFKNDLTDLLFAKPSTELLQVTYFPSNYMDSNYLFALTSSKTYRKLFSKVLSCDTKPANIRSRLKRAYYENKIGTLMLVKHVLTRRALFSYKDYMGLNFSVYNRRKDYFSSKRWRHNTYFSKYFGKKASAKRNRSERLISMEGGKLKRMRSKVEALDDMSSEFF